MSEGETIMQKYLKNILCLALAVLMLTPFAALAGAAPTEETQMNVPVWQRGDIVLHSEKTIRQPLYRRGRGRGLHP